MLIKCPKCAVNYNVPDDKLGNAPRKMRCNSCKHIFAIVRRSEAPPDGYEEFTGTSHALPPEFAFLREATSIPPSPHDVDPEESRMTPTAPPPVQSSETTYKGPPPQPPATTNTPSTPPAAVHAPSKLVEIAPTFAVAAPPASGTDTQVASSFERDEDETTQQVHKRFNRPPARTWESQDPLELDTFAVGIESPHTRLIGMIISATLLVCVLFFFFVSYRNGWSLPFNNMSKSVSYALSGRPSESLPSAVHGLEITVESTRTVKRNQAPPVLVVEGSIFNNTALNHAEVMVRLRIFDKDDEIALEVLSPCGQFHKESEIALMTAGQMGDSSKTSSCSLAADSTTVYQFMLEKFPAGFNKNDDIEVKVVNAVIR